MFALLPGQTTTIHIKRRDAHHHSFHFSPPPTWASSSADLILRPEPSGMSCLVAAPTTAGAGMATIKAMTDDGQWLASAAILVSPPTNDLELILDVPRANTGQATATTAQPSPPATIPADPPAPTADPDTIAAAAQPATSAPATTTSSAATAASPSPAATADAPTS